MVLILYMSSDAALYFCCFIFLPCFIKISLTVLKLYRADKIFIRSISKGHNFTKLQVELQFLFSSHCMILVYFSTQFYENIFDRI